MPIYKRCSRCGHRVPASATCGCVKNRHAEYKKYRTDKKEEAFYTSKEWQSIRLIVKDNCKDLDLYSLHILRKVEDGYTAHHIIELKEDWSRRLDLDNIIYLSESNHQLIHKAYRKGGDTKKNMQKLLFSLLKFGEVATAGGI